MVKHSHKILANEEEATATAPPGTGEHPWMEESTHTDRSEHMFRGQYTYRGAYTYSYR